jgi:RHS repeat-associated protein
VWRWDQQEPFGNNVPDENPSGLGVFDLPLRFPGQRYDKETNLHYNYFRDYDPSLGRYEESDPVGLRAGLNTYAYAEGDPLQFVDQLGLNSSRSTVQYGPIVEATSAFWNNYWNMRQARTPGADRYFHCMANCQAASYGTVGYGMSIVLSEMKEASDQYIKGYPPSDSDADRAANAAGRCTVRRSPGTDCKSICASFRPPSLDPRY